MRGRHLTTGVTLLVLAGILVVGALYGIHSLFEPVTGDGSSGDDTCTATNVKKGEKIRAKQVQVSVFNAGDRSGLADETMIKLAKRGFERGDTGNAPDNSKVKRVQVWTTQRRDPAARLVAKQFGPGTAVKHKDGDLGPGVDVVIGNGLGKLAKPTKVLVVKRAASACVAGRSSR